MTSSDLRFPVRRLHRHLPASLAAVLTLALGVGAVTALFGGAQSMLLRLPPFRAPEELVAVRLHPRWQAGTGSRSFPPAGATKRGLEESQIHP